MKKEELRIVFMGTPEFAVGTLKKLVENGYNVVAVVTQPDKPVGRHGSVLRQPPVKEYALQHNIPVLQPEKMKDESFVELLRTYNADIQVVVAFRMLPEVVWAMPRFGTFNVHAALLPQYRGAAPINWAIINGETQTGVTTFFLDHDVDTGRIILQKTFDIPQEADVEYVYDGLMTLGAEAAVDTLNLIIEKGKDIQSVAQCDVITDGVELKTAPKIFKETCKINWEWTCERIYNFVRGLCPVPGAWGVVCLPEGKELEVKVYQTRMTETCDSQAACGNVIKDKKRCYVKCADGLLEIVSIQPNGKKRMDGAAFANGYVN